MNGLWGLSAALWATACISTTDPAPGFFMSIEESRRLVCARTTFEVMRKRRPGLLDESRPRGEYADRDLVTCEEVVFGEGTRAPQDRALLDRLEAAMADIAKKVAKGRAGASGRTWLVEAHYSSPEVASKIAFAAKTALIENGLQVTDRLPVLAVGDIEVISRMSAFDAYDLACRRYFAPGRLEASDAVLSLLILDRRETRLHAGTCENGRWTWLE